jgi:hypothetical protein
MGSTYLSQMANWLRDAGLRVVEMDGWQQRARSSGGFEPGRPWCVMWHHTASTTTPANDANYICHNSPDAPISNLLVARDGEVWVLAGGATNTNGKGKAIPFSKGTVPKDSMNSYAVGVEIANSGVGEQYPQAQIDAMFTVNNTLAARLGLQPDDCSTHQFYAPDRKIDPATAHAVQGPWRPTSVTSSGTWSLPDITGEAWQRAGADTQEEDVEVVEVQVEGAGASFLGHRITQNTPRGSMKLILWVEWVDGRDSNQLARLQSYRQLGVPVHRMTAIADFKGVGLIGPVPTGDDHYNWSRSDFGNVIG